jgi:integrase
MPRTKLTAGRIREFTCPPDKAQVFLWDTEAPGLAVRATPGSELRAFIFQGRLNDKPLRVTIGDVRVWGIDAGRAEARRLQTEIDQGNDPREQKRERIAASEAKREEARRIDAPALDAWNEYLTARAARWSPRTLLDHQRLTDPGGKPKTRGRKKGEGDTTQPGILLPLLAHPLKQIDAAAVRAFLKDEAETRPTQAKNAFDRLRAFLNWCAERPEYQGQIHADACNGRAARDELPKGTPKDDCLQREQLRPWFEHVRALPAVPAAYLQALLLTGARREELAGLRWEDVDFRWKSITIKDKVDGERTIPLTPYVDGLLRELKRRNDTPPPEWRILDGKRIRNDLDAWKPSPWVFASKTAASGRLQEPRAAHNRAIASAGLPALSLHGLRRSFGTLAEWVECPAGVSAQIMGHKPSALAEKHYRRRPLDLLRVWHTKIEAWILEQAGIEQAHQEDAAPALRAVAN